MKTFASVFVTASDDFFVVAVGLVWKKKVFVLSPFG